MFKRMRVILLFILYFIMSNVFALDYEIDIKRSTPALPRVVVKIENGYVYWNVYASKGINVVALTGLNEKDALNMLSIAEKAHSSYDEIIAIGRCPRNIIKSGSLGQIGHVMKFEVVCERNNIMLHIIMYDEYVLNYIVKRVEASDLTKLANSIINELRKHQSN